MKSPTGRLCALAAIMTSLVIAISDVAGTFGMGQQAAARKIVPFVPTPQNVVDRMIELANVGQGDLLYISDRATAESSSPRRRPAPAPWASKSILA